MTSASKVFVTSGADAVLMGFHQLLGLMKLLGKQAEVLRQRDGRFQPVLGFTIGVGEDMHSQFFTRKEEQAERTLFNDCRRHGYILSLWLMKG